MSKPKIGMTGRSKNPPKAEAQPLGTTKASRAKAPARRAARRAAEAQPASDPFIEGIQAGTDALKAQASMAERLAALPNAEPEVRAALDEIISGATQISLDTQDAVGVSLQQQNEETLINNETLSAPAAAPGMEKTMTLTFKNLSKNGKNAFYTGAAVALRVPLSAFPNKTAPASIEVADGVFAPAKQPKSKMTAEERKAQRASTPKPTLAERIAKREAALQRDREKLAKEQAAGAQPQL